MTMKGALVTSLVLLSINKLHYALPAEDGPGIWCDSDGCPHSDQNAEIAGSNVNDDDILPTSCDDISEKSPATQENEQSSDVRSGIKEDIYAKNNITNSYDYKIRDALDKADRLMEKERFKDANKEYERLLKLHRNSPRARYGVALAHEKVSQLSKDNWPLLGQALDHYEQVLDMKDVPTDLAIMAARQIVNSRNTKKKEKLLLMALRELANRQPDRLDQQNKYGKKLINMNRNEEAKAVFAKVLKKDSSNGMAQSYYGLLLKQLDDRIEEAVKYMLAGMATGEEGSRDKPMYTYLGNALMRLGRRDEAYEIQKEGARKGYFLSAKQRSKFNVRRLTGRPWWTVEESTYESELKEIEQNWKMIRDEALSLIRNHRNALAPDYEKIATSGNWDQFDMFARGKMITENCKLVPRTCKLLSKFEDAASCRRGQVKFSIVEGGTRIFPHCGPTNCRIRAHLGLVVSPEAKISVMGDARSWIPGKFIIFDDSFEHEVWHDGTEMRLVLIVDFWHPELTQKERETLSAV